MVVPGGCVDGVENAVGALQFSVQAGMFGFAGPADLAEEHGVVLPSWPTPPGGGGGGWLAGSARSRTWRRVTWLLSFILFFIGEQIRWNMKTTPIPWEGLWQAEYGGAE